MELWNLVKVAATIALDWVLGKVDQMTEGIKETLRFLGLLDEEQPKQMMIAGAPGAGMPVYMPVSDVTATRAPIYHDIPDTSEAAPKDELDLLASFGPRQPEDPNKKPYPYRKIVVNVNKEDKQSDARTGTIVAKKVMREMDKQQTLGVHGEG